MEVLPGLDISLEAILLVLILLLMLARFVLDRRESGGRDLRRHSDRLLRSLNDPELDQKLHRVILLEAALAARVEEHFDFLEKISIEELGIEYEEAGHTIDSRSRLERIRGLFSRENAARLGGMLKDKLLKLLNTYLGLG